MSIDLIRRGIFLSFCGALGVAQAFAQDIPGDTSTTAEIAPGRSVPSEFEQQGDSDWFRVQLRGGFSYAWEFHGKYDGEFEASGAYLTLRDATGLEIDTVQSTTPGGQRYRREFNASVDGEYFVDVSYSYPPGTYKLVMDQADEIGDRDDLAGAIEPGEVVASRLDGMTDRDWFEVDLQEGLSYGWMLPERGSGASDILGPHLDLLDANGDIILSAGPGRGSDKAARLNYTADRDQRAFVAVSTTYTYLRPHGNYNLYSWGPDQYVTGTGTTATIAPLARVESEIVASGDADWFRVQMQAGRTYQFDLLGEETNAGTLPRTKLELHAADGTLLMEDAGGGTGTNSRLSYTPETDGIRFISTQGESSEDVGTYVLTVNPLDDYRADKNTLGRLSPGFSATGTLESTNDADWFRFFAEAGKPYVINFDGKATEVGSVEAPWIRIFNSQGDKVDESVSFPHNHFLAPATGVYYMSASDRNGGTGTYRLRMSNPNAVVRPTARLFATVSPASRTVQVGRVARFYASIINVGPGVARLCGIAANRAIPAKLEFRARTSANSTLLPINQRVGILAPGQAAHFELTYQPSLPFGATGIPFAFDCLNANPAPIVSGVNTFVLGSTLEATPDTVLRAITPSNDGVLRLPSPGGANAFAVAATNLGKSGEVYFRADPYGVSLIVRICETNPANGQCLAPYADSVRRTVAAGESVTFTVHVQGKGVAIPLNRGSFRVLMKALDPTSNPIALVGTTGVAVTTQ